MRQLPQLSQLSQLPQRVNIINSALRHTHSTNIQSSVQSHTTRLLNNVTIFGSAFKYGQKKDGVERAPIVMDNAGLVDRLTKAGNTVKYFGPVYPEREDVPIPKIVGSYAANLTRKIYQERLEGNKIINIGGDHSVAIGSINGVLRHDPETIIVFIDAHADINTFESSPSGNMHGMPLAFVTGLEDSDKLGSSNKYLVPRLRFDRLGYIGIRDLDPFEKEIIKKHKIINYSSDDVMKQGGEFIAEKVIRKLDPSGKRPIHVSFDIDVFDPSVVCGTGSLAENGIGIVEAYRMLTYLRNTGRVVGMDMVEVNPSLDNNGVTVYLAMSCIEILFDQRV